MHGRNRLEILVKDHLSPVWSHRIVFQMIFEIVEGDALDGGLTTDRGKGEPFDSAQEPAFDRDLLDRLSSGGQEYDSIHQVAIDLEVLVGADGDVEEAGRFFATAQNDRRREWNETSMMGIVTEQIPASSCM